MKIHLGCGKKLLPGYVNCDVAPFGAKPDIQFDLLDQRWPFDDECADEILAVHVWEHFYECDHPHLASECRRVLKPGGLLVLEMPNLQLAARNFVNDPENEQYGYWGIYGDPKYSTDPHMMHKGGWWPAKLEAFLNQHGFSGATSGPPEHKGRKVRRDFRCVAWKT